MARAMRPLLIAALSGVVLLALAQDLPQFRKGLWQFQRTVSTAGGEPQTLESERCVNPTDEMKKQNEMLAQVGCKSSAVTRTGDTYSFSADCNVNGVPVKSKSVITVENDSGYRVEVESQQGAQATKESLVARRVGAC